MSAKVTVILLNWNGWKDTLTCLDSLRQQDWPSLQILLVDNASSDDSVAKLRTHEPTLSLLETTQNLGFAGGCNVGIREALAGGAEWVWLLNNDTTLSPQTLRHMVELGESEENIGLVGSPIFEQGASGRMQAWGGGWVHPLTGISWHTLRANESHEAPRWLQKLPLLSALTSQQSAEWGQQHRSLLWELAVQLLALLPGRWPYLTGASLLLRREMLEEVGLLDERFFFTWEDCDLCIRALKAGWKLCVAEEGRVWHRISASSGHKTPLRMRLQARAQVHFSQKHSPLPLLSSLVYASEEGIRLAAQGRWDSLRALMKGVREGWQKGR